MEVSRAALASSKLVQDLPEASYPLSVPFSREDIEAWKLVRHFLDMSFSDYVAARFVHTTVELLCAS